MFDFIKNANSIVTVTENNDIIRVGGRIRKFIYAEILNRFNTSKIATNLFINSGLTGFEFYSFFALEFVFILQQILNEKTSFNNKSTIEETIKLLHKNTWLRSVKNIHNSRLRMERLNDLTVTPLPAQMEFFKHYDSVKQKYRLNGYLLDAAPGTGKTITSITLSHLLNKDVFIAIVPKNSLKNVWEKTFSTLFKSPIKLWTSIESGDAPTDCSHYAFHYESLGKAIELAKALRAKGKSIFIDLDECHNFNTIDSNRTLSFCELCKISKCEDVLWMSGTPIKAIGKEVIPLLRTIDPYFTKIVEKNFIEIFGKNNTKALEILASRLGIVKFTIQKAQVNKIETNFYRGDVLVPDSNKYTLESIRKQMKDFITERSQYYEKHKVDFIKSYDRCLVVAEFHFSNKEKEDFIIYKKHIKTISAGYNPELHMEIAKFCNMFENDVIIPKLSNEDKKIFRNAKSVVKYISLKIQGEALGRILGKTRTQCNIDIVKAAMKSIRVSSENNSITPYTCTIGDIIDNAAKKTLLFTSYVEVVDNTYDILSQEGYTPLRVYGDTNKDLPKIIDNFTKTDILNPLVATFQSLSTAVPMVMANTIIMLNSPFRIHEREQTIARCNRLGQTTNVDVFDIFLDTGDKPNISTRSEDILKWSKEQVDLIMGTNTSPSNLDVSLESLLPDDCREIVKLDTQFIPRW